MNYFLRLCFILLAGTLVAGCIQTTMQGYADRNLPAKPVTQVAALVTAQGALAVSLQTSIQQEARKRGLLAVDALQVFPPTRTYSDAEIRKGLLEQGIDGVLLVNVGDTGVIKEYAGTVFYGQYSGSSVGDATFTSTGNFATGTMNTTSSGTLSGGTAPTYHYSRQTSFTARLVEPSTGRSLWIGNGQVKAGGALFVGDGASASSSIAAIFDDLQSKGLIGRRPTS